MDQELVTSTTTKPKGTIGEQIRKIADRLQRETDVQITATSRILGAAAQISENHDQLIREVVGMVEEDLENQSFDPQTNTFTVNSLKQHFKSLSEAKAHFGLKASSWIALCNKLNSLSTKTLIPSNDSEISLSKQLYVIETDIRAIRAEVSQVMLLLQQLISDKQ
jgi:hypothetical protein